MVSIPLGLGDWESPSENIPRLRLRNMYITDNPNSPDGLARVTRPALSEFTAIGDGPINGMWQQDGTLDGDWLIVSSDTLYRLNEAGIAEELGEVIGPGFCQFAGTADRVLIVRNGTAYSTDGETVSIVVMPDDVPPYEGNAAPVGSVACINSTFILTVEGTQRFYWINPGEVDPDPLNFASAERSPDPIISVNVLTDELWFIGETGPEVWQVTSDPEDPFARINGRVYNEGCASRDAVCSAVFNNYPCLIWVTDARAVVLAQGATSKISSESVEEALRSAENLRAWTFRYNRHDFYVLTADEFTYAFDLTRREWSRWDSYGEDNFKAHLGFQIGSSVYGATSNSNKIFILAEGSSDDGDPIIREISGVIHNPGRSVPCSSVSLRVNAGWSPSYGFTPKLEMRWSDDQGTTWSDYVEASLGDRGMYSEYVIYRALGRITHPARNFEFRFTEDCTFRIDAAYMNEV